MVFALETYCPASDGFRPRGSRRRSSSPRTAPASSRSSPPRTSSSPTPTESRSGLTRMLAPTELSHPEDPLTDLWIGGKAVPASDGGRFDVLDPATGQVLTTVADGSVDDALAAVDAADAPAGWAATPPRERSESSPGLRPDDRGAEDLAQLITLENGKALADAKGEVAYAAEFFRWFAEEAVRRHRRPITAPAGPTRSSCSSSRSASASWSPRGTSRRRWPPARSLPRWRPAAPSSSSRRSDTPLTALAMARILDEAGVPAGVVNVLPARRSGAVVSAMLHDPRVRKLSFTGSTEVGRVLLKEAADQVINCSMELGGNAPFLVLADADLDAAVDGAMVAKMRNGGEACTAANRFYVAARVAEEFGRRLAERMTALAWARVSTTACSSARWSTPTPSTRSPSWCRARSTRGPRLSSAAAVRTAPGFFYEPTVLSTCGRARRSSRGDLRPGRADRPLRRRGRGDPAGQRHRVRPGLLRLHR